MPASLTFELGFGPASANRPADDGQPMRLLVLGGFSGATPLAQRTAARIDIDNIDQAMARLAPGLRLELDGAAAGLRFSELDDFHPDHLYQKTDAFRSLREERQRLCAPGAVAAGPTPASASPGAGAGDFASLLGGPVKRPAAIDQLVKGLLGAAATPAPPRPEQAIAALEQALGARMRAVLHAPAFQALEALWRGVHELVTGLELDDGLQLWLFDMSEAELRSDLAAGAPVLRRLLIDAPLAGADAAPWGLLCGAWRFGANEQDLAVLDALGQLAMHAGAPFIGGACDSLAGTDPLAAWDALRAAPHAPWLGLALPRVLLRLPYGRATDRIDSFDFEEADAQPAHEQYLWGHASLACALLLGRAFGESGWDLAPDDQLELDGLPAHVVREGGEARMQACAERYLSESAGNALLQRGLMPLLSFRNRPAVRLLRSQSLSQPARALAGAWHR